MKLDVIKQRKLWWTVSIAVTVIGFLSMAISWKQLGAPLRPSLDFIGGTRFQIGLDCTKADCKKPIDLDGVRKLLDAQGLTGSTVQAIDAQGQKAPGLSSRTNSKKPWWKKSEPSIPRPLKLTPSARP
jgi:preprotein translocase subunit SecF